jgi:hypothetical protein
MYQEPPPDWEPQIIWKEQPVLKSHIEDEFPNPDNLMPHPLRKCKLCGYKGYGVFFKNHKCIR